MGALPSNVTVGGNHFNLSATNNAVCIIFCRTRGPVITSSYAFVPLRADIIILNYYSNMNFLLQKVKVSYNNINNNIILAMLEVAIGRLFFNIQVQ